MSKLTTPLRWAEIDLNALAHNVRVLCRYVRRGTQLMAVIKKNAYGHGAVPIARTVLAAGADCLGVYSLEEGLEVRQANITVPILIMGCIPSKEAVVVIREDLIPTVIEPELALALDRVARDCSTTVRVHVKIDTGLHRSGVSFEDAARLLNFLFSLEHLRVVGLYTHFSSADQPDKAPTETQLERFLNLAEAFPTVKYLHAANSAATLRFPETHLNLVRVGIALYGLYPSPSMERNVPLRPVLSLKGRVIRIHHLKAGDGVGYGLTWIATNDALVALIPLGYGDGLPRLLSNRGEALVHGRRAPVRGTISMDQCVVEVTNVPEVKIGDEVTFIGSQPPEQITADEVASWASTINYDVVTAIPSRLPRVYLSGESSPDVISPSSKV